MHIVALVYYVACDVFYVVLVVRPSLLSHRFVRSVWVLPSLVSSGLLLMRLVVSRLCCFNASHVLIYLRTVMLRFPVLHG